jgi:cytochrome P450
VKEDTLLSDRWFFKKNAVVQIAGGVIHADPGIWGEGAGEFEALRFIKLAKQTPSASSSQEALATSQTTGNGTDATQTEEKSQGGDRLKGIHPAAFRAFGGGKTLCPGRHFATHEILAFVAMIVLTVDLEAVDKDGKAGGNLVVPEKEDGVLPVHILEPKTDVMVKVRVRKDGGEVIVVR